MFIANTKGVSNPLEKLRWLFKDADEKRSLVRPERPLDAKLSDFPGGIQLWASNPALLWTAARPEEEGIHFHGYAADKSTRIVDETYSAVTLAGLVVDEEQLRYYMAQKTLAHLRGRVVCLVCACGAVSFDRGLSAFMPHSDHECSACGAKLYPPGPMKKVVSNPILLTINALNQAQGIQ